MFNSIFLLKHQFNRIIMKKALIVICFCVLSSTAKSIVSDPPSTAESILLIGVLDVSAGPNDVLAYYYENAVYISFIHNYGNVSISLYNTSHFLVYNDIFNTDVETVIYIPIIDNSYGTYTLVMESANGYAEGEFEIQP